MVDLFFKSQQAFEAFAGTIKLKLSDKSANAAVSIDERMDFFESIVGDGGLNI